MTNKQTTKQSPLHEVHRRLGASFTQFAGWTMPLRYGSETAEHHAVRLTAGLFDLSHMGEIEVVGPAAAAVLDRALVGRASQMRSGRARYSMLCTRGILDDLVVYRLADDRFLVVCNAANTAVVDTQLRYRAGGQDAQVRNVTDDWALVAVQGPASAAIVGALTHVVPTSLRYYTVAAATIAGTQVLLARTGYTGEDGFEIYTAAAEATVVWEALAGAGTRLGLLPAGLSCRDSLRLEAGMPLYGHELGTHVTPYDAGLGRFVDLDKPDGFVGDIALRLRRDQAAPVHTLVGLVSRGRRAPRPRQRVLDPHTGAHVGEITSGAPSPTLGHPIAMAYIYPEYAEPETRLTVVVRDHHEDVQVTRLPFYRRKILTTHSAASGDHE
ncbi:MAG: glycine cleavage system aminomethyltransferase GcvT [Nocardioidaceae bacterium]